MSSLVNLHALRQRLAQPPELSGERNLSSLQGWVRFTESVGRPVNVDGVQVIPCEESPIWQVPRKFVQIDGLARAYEVGDGAQNCSKETRQDGHTGLCVAEVDMQVANYQIFVNELRAVASDAQELCDIIDPINRSIEHSKVQRTQLAEYYSISVANAKQIFLRLPFDGSLRPDSSWESPNQDDILPFLLELRHAFRRGQTILHERSMRFQEVCKLPKVKDATNPEASALALFLQDGENTVIWTVAGSVSLLGLIVLCYIFDGLLVLGSSPEHLSRVFKAAASDVYRRTGVKLALKDLRGDVLESYDAAAGRVEVFTTGAPEQMSKRSPSPAAVALAATSSRKRQRLDSQPISTQLPGNLADALSRVYSVPNSCIAWSLLVCCPNLIDVPTFMQTPGPHTYEAFADAVKEQFHFEVVENADQIPDCRLLHTKAPPSEVVDHCCPVWADGTVREPDDDGQPMRGSIGAHDVQGRVFIRLVKADGENT